MSKKEKDAKTLASKKTPSQQLKELSKIEGKYLHVSEGIDKATLTLALQVKSQMEQLEGQLKELDNRYQSLRDELLAQIEGIETSVYDTVEYNNEGQRAFKYPKNSKSGQVDEQKLETLAKQKRVLSKVFKKVRVINEVELLKLLQSGKITVDEYRAVTIQKISPVLEIKKVAEVIDTNAEENAG
jgi:hypothetical protein